MYYFTRYFASLVFTQCIFFRCGGGGSELRQIRILHRVEYHVNYVKNLKLRITAQPRQIWARNLPIFLQYFSDISHLQFFTQCMFSGGTTYNMYFTSCKKPRVKMRTYLEKQAFCLLNCAKTHQSERDRIFSISFTLVCPFSSQIIRDMKKSYDTKLFTT